VILVADIPPNGNTLAGFFIKRCIVCARRKSDRIRSCDRRALANPFR
jgi:hypothetical protein